MGIVRSMKCDCCERVIAEEFCPHGWMRIKLKTNYAKKGEWKPEAYICDVCASNIVRQIREHHCNPYFGETLDKHSPMPELKTE